MFERKRALELFDTYSDYYEDRVKSGIEDNRKGWFEVIVYDNHCSVACSGAKVKIKQKNHEFKYGANIFMLDGFETEEKNKKYREVFADTFNMATLPFYWLDVEPECGKLRFEKDSPEIYRRPPIDLCIEYCKANNIEPREHGLAYSGYFPKWLDMNDPELIKASLEKRCQEIAQRYADDIPVIEVTNENDWTVYLNALYEQGDFIETCFEIAEKYFPENKLSINECTNVWRDFARTRDKYYMVIEKALKSGARIDAIGMQYHLFARSEDEYKNTRLTYNPLHLYKILDRYSDFNLPLQITEVTIPAYSEQPEDEEFQAQAIEKLYRLWFSHKNVEQIIYWNVIDGYAGFGKQNDMTKGENYFRGGLFRYDFTPKPAYYVIKNLFEKEWRTNEELILDNDGKGLFKGFYGEYDIEIDYNGKRYEKNIKLSKNRANNVVNIII